MSEHQRLSINDVDPKAFASVVEVEKYVHSRRIGKELGHLIKIRASQINHCAWCLDMHHAEAVRDGMDERKLNLIPAWREAPAWFDEKEQAILALTEQVTLIADQGVTDDVWAQVTKHFTDAEIVPILTAIAAINVWNRMNVAARTDIPDKPGSFG